MYKSYFFFVNTFLFLFILGKTNKLKTKDSQCANPFLKSPDNPAGIPGLEFSVLSNNLKFCQMLKQSEVCCQNSFINNMTILYLDKKNEIIELVKERDHNFTKSFEFLIDIFEGIKSMKVIERNIDEFLAKYQESSSFLEFNDKKNQKLKKNDVSTQKMKLKTKTNKKTQQIFSEKKAKSIIKEKSKNYNVKNLIAFFQESPYTYAMINLTFYSPFSIYFNRTQELQNFSIDEILKEFLPFLNTKYIAYQAFRQECYNDLLKYFTKFICMGCSTYTSFFLNQQLHFKSDVCSNMTSHCYDYLNLNDLINILDDTSLFNETYEIINSSLSVANEINELINGNLKKPSEISQEELQRMQVLFNQIETILSYNKTSTYVNKSKRFPTEECYDINNCQYICDNFLNVHGLNQEVFINPGVNGTISNNTTTQNESKSNNSDNDYFSDFTHSENTVDYSDWVTYTSSNQLIELKSLRSNNSQVLYDSEGYDVINVKTGMENQIDFNYTDNSTRSLIESSEINRDASESIEDRIIKSFEDIFSWDSFINKNTFMKIIVKFIVVILILII